MHNGCGAFGVLPSPLWFSGWSFRRMEVDGWRFISFGELEEYLRGGLQDYGTTGLPDHRTTDCGLQTTDHATRTTQHVFPLSPVTRHPSLFLGVDVARKHDLCVFDLGEKIGDVVWD